MIRSNFASIAYGMQSAVFLQSDSSMKPEDQRSTSLVDGCGRTIDHLRISVIDDCDLHCVYCRPGDHAESVGRAGALSDSQRLEFIRFLYERYGLSHVRITGGEPLIYRGVVSFIAKLRDSFPGLSIAMTTHGRLLRRMSHDLMQAGLTRLNISVDSLQPDRYARLTQGRLADVLDGMDAAAEEGFDPPKINVVVLRNQNDDEVIDLARWAFSRGSEIRFLEAMPIGPAAAHNKASFVASAETMEVLKQHFVLEPFEVLSGETARRYRAVSSDESGVLGFISPVSEPFCSSCRRIRITAAGELFPCLLDSRSVHLQGAWRSGLFQPDQAVRLVLEAVSKKKPRGSVQAAGMVTLGG